MALISNFNQAGDGIVISKSRDVRRYQVGDAPDLTDFIETTVSETVEWVGLTKECAQSQIDLNTQPAINDSSFSYSMEEDSRVIKSYRLRRVFEQKIVIVADTTPTPTVQKPFITLNNGVYASFPQSATIYTTNSLDKIWYRVDGQDTSGNYVSGTWTQGEDNNITRDINTTVIAGGYQGAHKRIKLLAQARRTIGSTVYTGENAEIIMYVAAPSLTNVEIADISFSGGGSFPYPNSYPTTIIISNLGSNSFYWQKEETFANGASGNPYGEIYYPSTNQFTINWRTKLNSPFGGKNYWSGVAITKTLVIDGFRYSSARGSFYIYTN